MRVAVFGGSGFVGGHLVGRLKSERGISVTSVDKSNYDLSSYSDVDKLRSDYGSFDVIVLLASLVSVEESLTTPRDYFGNNLSIVWNVYTLFPEALVIFPLTSANGSSPYGASKFLAETLVKNNSSWWFRTSFLELANIYGEGGKGFLDVVGDGSFVTDTNPDGLYVYRYWTPVDVVVDCIVRLLYGLGGIYTSVPGCFVTLKDIADYLESKGIILNRVESPGSESLVIDVSGLSEYGDSTDDCRSSVFRYLDRRFGFD